MLAIVIITSLVTFLVLILSSAAYLISVIIDDESDDDSEPGASLGIDMHDFTTTPVASPVDPDSGRRHSINLDELRSLGTVCNCLKLLESYSNSSNDETSQSRTSGAAIRASGNELGTRGAEERNRAMLALAAATTEKSLTCQDDVPDPQICHQAAMLATAASIATGPEELQCAEANSELLKASESQRELLSSNTGSGGPTVEGPQSNTSLDSHESLAGLSSWHKSASAQKDLIASQLGTSVSKQVFDDFDSRDLQLGGTALHWCKTRKCLDRLIRLGLPTDIVNKRNETALHVAVRRHRLQILIGLLNYGANVECRNDNGETPLILACKVNDIYAVQLLLIFDANPNATDNANLTARHYTASICDKNTINSNQRQQQQQQQSNQQKQQKLQEHLPSAAHLILAMLNEVGAKRCKRLNISDKDQVSSLSESSASKQTKATKTGAENGSASAASRSDEQNPASSSKAPSGLSGANPGRTARPHHQPPGRSHASRLQCTDGCSPSGAYNGNSYNRWPSYQRESLYKRHLFSDLIEQRISDIMRGSSTAAAGTAKTSGAHFEASPGNKPKAANSDRLKHVDDKSSTSGAGGASRGVAKSRMLCIDGGGLRGVIVCQIMIEMERYLKRPMIGYFDWVAGTSVGAFLACALCRGVPMRELRRICFDVKDEVFSGAKPYNSKFLERVLKRTFGTTTRLSDVKNTKLAVTSVLADRDPCQLKFFRNYKSAKQMLETHGFPADVYSTMTGQTMISRSSKRQPSGSSQTKSTAAGPPKLKEAVVTGITNSTSSVSGAIKEASIDGGSSGNGKLDTSLPHRTSEVNADINSNSTDASVLVGRKIDTISKIRNASSQQREIRATGGRDDQKQAPTAAHMTSDLKHSQSQKVVAASKLAKTASESPPPMASMTNSSREQVDSMLDENDQDPLMWQAVRASAAAPFFFKPYGPFLDGGIIANNPTLDMLNEFFSHQKVKQFLRRRLKHKSDGQRLNEVEGPDGELDVVVSLGTGRGRVIGRQAMADFGQIASGFSAVFSPVELVRSIRAARDLFKRLMHQSCHTDDHILDRAQGWCCSLDIPYFRLNPPLATIFSIDDKRDEQLINALWQTKLYMRAMKDQLIELAELLDSN